MLKICLGLVEKGREGEMEKERQRENSLLMDTALSVSLSPVCSLYVVVKC